MKYIVLIYLAFQLCICGAMAQKKSLVKSFKLLKEAKDYQEKNSSPEAAKKNDAKITWKYKDAGNTFLKSDTGLSQEEKMTAQYFALSCFNKAQDLMVKAKRTKDIITLADNTIPHLWMRTEKLPKAIRWDSLAVPVNLTAEDYVSLRDLYIANAIDIAESAGDWKAVQRLEPFYLSILPEAEKRGDVTAFNKRLDGFFEMAYASGMNKDAPASRDNAYNFYEYALKKRNLVEDKRRLVARANALDSLFHSAHFNYTDFDDNIKVRAVAAKVFEKLDDNTRAYRLYDEAINSGSKSISLMLGRMNVAAAMQDFNKLEVALKPLSEKKFASELSREQEKRVKECRAMLKKEM